MSGQPLALEYHGKAQAEGHWRRGQELIDALAYIDPLTPDVKQQVDKLIEEEMRRSTKRPADYVKELPPVPPARFGGHTMLQQEYERVRATQPMPPLDVTRYRLDPPPQNKANDYSAWLAARNNAHAQLEHQLGRIANLELLLRFGANAWRAQVAFDEGLLKQSEATLQGLRKSIDQLNRERKLQQQAAGAELRVLEDQYYSALRKNLEISAACQAIEEEMALLQAKIGRIEKQQQQLGEQQGGQEAQEQQQEGGGGGEEAAAAEGAVANGVEGQQSGEQQSGEQQPGGEEAAADMEQ
uniref:Pre-mRNA-splicing factor SPF27 n=1 Tax=Tetradesmus obliquus TaxID=3088 RepID=A0A383VNY3_TETOB|eukprot:jgi/Sobl393_1/5631/SZX67237.1